MAVMQEFGKLLAQAFVALAMVADDDRVLEQLFLNGLWQLCPKVKRRRAEQRSKTVVLFRHVPSWRPAGIAAKQERLRGQWVPWPGTRFIWADRLCDTRPAPESIPCT